MRDAHNPIYRVRNCSFTGLQVFHLPGSQLFIHRFAWFPFTGFAIVHFTGLPGFHLPDSQLFISPVCRFSIYQVYNCSFHRFAGFPFTRFAMATGAENPV